MFAKEYIFVNFLPLITTTSLRPNPALSGTMFFDVSHAAIKTLSVLLDHIAAMTPTYDHTLFFLDL